MSILCVLFENFHLTHSIQLIGNSNGKMNEDIVRSLKIFHGYVSILGSIPLHITKKMGKKLCVKKWNELMSARNAKSEGGRDVWIYTVLVKTGLKQDKWFEMRKEKTQHTIIRMHLFHFIVSLTLSARANTESLMIFFFLTKRILNFQNGQTHWYQCIFLFIFSYLLTRLLVLLISSIWFVHFHYGSKFKCVFENGRWPR